MNLSSRNKSFLILFSGAFLSLAPLWASRVQTLWGRTLFGSADPFVLVGVTLLVSLLACYLLPDFLVTRRMSQVTSHKSRNERFMLLSDTIRIISTIFSLSSLVFGLYWINQHIIHSFLSSADEHSCYFLAECLRKGKLYVETPAMADFFKVVHVGMRDGKWFSVYPLGWPLIWAIGLIFNIVDWLNPVMTALSVLFFYLAGIRLFSRWSVVCGLVVCVSNPFFLFTGAAYFSHATCLLCISVFLYSFLRWRETRASVILGTEDCKPVILSRPFSKKEGGSVILRKAEGLTKDLNRDSSPTESGIRMTKRRPSETSEIFWASVCGFAVGYGLMTRYLTMAAVVGSFLLYHYLPIFFGWKGWPPAPKGQGRMKWLSWLRFLPFTFKRPQLRRSDWIAVGIIAIFMISILYQNYLVTGKAFRPPNKHDKSWERLGFRKDYTPVDGFLYLISRIFYLADWFAPQMIAAYLFIIFLGFGHTMRGVILRTKDEESHQILPSDLAFARKHGGQDDERNESLRGIFRLSMVFIAFAYFFYYSWGGNQWGPRYYWEGMPFLCIAVMDWIVSLWQGGSLHRRMFLFAFVLTSLVTSGRIFTRQAEYVEESSRQRKALYDLAESTTRKPAIVFIHGFIGSRLIFAEEDAIRNSPFLDTRILYAHDLGDRNKELMAAYPGREYYRGTYDATVKKPKLETL